MFDDENPAGCGRCASRGDRRAFLRHAALLVTGTIAGVAGAAPSALALPVRFGEPLGVVGQRPDLSDSRRRRRDGRPRQRRHRRAVPGQGVRVQPVVPARERRRALEGRGARASSAAGTTRATSRTASTRRAGRRGTWIASPSSATEHARRGRLAADPVGHAEAAVGGGVHRAVASGPGASCCRMRAWSRRSFSTPRSSP